MSNLSWSAVSRVEALRKLEGVRGVSNLRRVNGFPVADVRWWPSFGGDVEAMAWVDGAGWVAASAVA